MSASVVTGGSFASPIMYCANLAAGVVQYEHARLLSGLVPIVER